MINWRTDSYSAAAKPAYLRSAISQQERRVQFTSGQQETQSQLTPQQKPNIPTPETNAEVVLAPIDKRKPIKTKSSPTAKNIDAP